MPDWLSSIIGLIGVIIGVGISEFRHWRDTKEQYRIMTFEKRLVVYQEAYYWVTRLIDALYQITDPDTEEDKIQSIKNTANDVRDWWDKNCLLLDHNTRIHINETLLYLRDYTSSILRKYHPEKLDKDKVNESLWGTITAIKQGAGVKHLPEMHKSKN